MEDSAQKVNDLYAIALFDTRAPWTPRRNRRDHRKMASSSSSSAKLLYGDSKARINQRVRYTIDGIGSLSRNLVRSSKSSETLMQAAKVTSQQEHILESADLVNIYFSLL